MKYTEERRHLCVLCKAMEVVEQRTVETTDTAPDQCNCDLNKYSDVTLEGGKILKRGPFLGWVHAPAPKATSPSGLCTSCLANPDFAALLPHIEFRES